MLQWWRTHHQFAQWQWKVCSLFSKTDMPYPLAAIVMVSASTKPSIKTRYCVFNRKLASNQLRSRNLAIKCQ